MDTTGEPSGEARRMFEPDGAQVVQVGEYAWSWRGFPPLAVGDRVVLMMPPWRGEVTELGTTYGGSLLSIVRREAEDHEDTP